MWRWKIVPFLCARVTTDYEYSEQTLYLIHLTSIDRHTTPHSMLKTAFLALLCGSYADTIYVLVLVFGLLFGIEGEAWREPVFSLALQAVLGLTLASLVRRSLYGEDGQWWTISGLINNSHLPQSYERVALVPFLYLASLGYNDNVNGLPEGVFVTLLLISVLLWLFDVVVHMHVEHVTHRKRFSSDDNVDSSTAPPHDHVMTNEKFRSPIVVFLLAALIVYPDIIVVVVQNKASQWLWGFPLIAAVANFLIAGTLKLFLGEHLV